MLKTSCEQKILWLNFFSEICECFYAATAFNDCLVSIDFVYDVIWSEQTLKQSLFCHFTMLSCPILSL